jgi:hypothetical protein
LFGTLLFAALFWTLDLGVLRAGVPHPLDDNWEDNLIARNLLQGVGFRSQMIYPPLWPLHDPKTLTVPVLIHGPLLPLAMAPPLALFGARALDRVAWLAAVLALLTLVPLFRVVARHFGEVTAAIAGLLFTLSPLTLEAAHHSLSVVAGALLLAWAVELLDRERPRAIGAGLSLGLGVLVRPEMLIAAAVLALFAWLGSRRPNGPVTFLAVFAVCGAPWWWHHARIAGSPFFNLSSYTLIGFWGDRPDASVMRDFSLTLDRWPRAFQAALPALPRKWLAFFPHAAKHALFAPSGATGWLALLGLVAGLRARESRRFALLAFALALIPVASMTLTSYQPLYLEPFLPLYAAGAAAGVHALIGALPRWAHRPRAEIGVMALLILPSILPALREASLEARAAEGRIAGERRALAAAIAPGALRPMFSDTPDFVAWTTGRPVFWTPREEFERLYASDGAAARNRALPPRDEALGWFHDDARDPATIGGFVTP